MNYKLTQHARHVVEERQIAAAWIERVLDSPQRIEPDPDDPQLQHHLGRIAEHGNRVLRVVYNKTTSPPLIVTVYFDRAMRNRL
jgi:hypothetical protein